MIRMIRDLGCVALAGLCAMAFAAPASAELSKEESCKYQGQVMTAVQTARLDRVAEDKVQDTILASEPEWPENFSNAIPQLTAHVYQMRRRDLKKIDLGAVFETQCLENWDQIQAMKEGLSGN